MSRSNQKPQGNKGGIVTDTSYLNQPTGTLTFALNAVNNTENGDKEWRINEQSNEPCYQLTAGFTPIGDVYIDKSTTVIFSVSEDESISEIGIVKEGCKYEVQVSADLGFTTKNQISATYRLRLGCERTIYFTTPTPMVYNLDKPNDFKVDPTDATSAWDKDKFSLFKTYDSIPTFNGVEILESGVLPPGSYNAAIQYLDEDFNPTEWISTSEPVRIYNDSTSKEYLNTRGATSIENTATNFGQTNKSIRFTFGNFDNSYLYYRVAIIASNTGSGLISKVNYSAPISTNVHTYTYTGESSTVTVGTEEEILAFNSIIHEAEYIEQIENKLILAKIKGNQTDFCSLQKYASRIQADVIYKTIDLNNFTAVDDRENANPKSPTVDFNGTGYMPGEIYSFGIVYIFDDYTLSPAYHIPGKHSTSVFGEMSIDNECGDRVYQDSSCQNYWGNDAMGLPLENEKIRHHRFPTREEVGKPLYTKVKEGQNIIKNKLIVKLTGTILETITTTSTISYRVSYTIGGVAHTVTETFIISDYDPLVGIEFTVANSVDTVNIVSIEENLDEAGFVNIGLTGVSSVNTGLSYTNIIDAITVNNTKDTYTAEIMGINFSGVDIPDEVDLGGRTVIGYYIVRNERTSEQRTVLDTGVLVPMLIEQDRDFIAHCFMYPELTDKTRISTDTFALIHPEHKFHGTEYKNVTSIRQTGEYLKGNQARSSLLTQDVGAGTSYDPDIHKRSSADYDGFSLHTVTRDTETDHTTVTNNVVYTTANGEVFYLDALNSRTVEDLNGDTKDIYNVSGDNKIGVVKLANAIADPTFVHDTLPYVTLERDVENPYGNFRSLRYYKVNMNPIMFIAANTDPLFNGTTASVFNGDSYITPLRYHSAIYNNFRLIKRKTKSGLFKKILGALLVVVGTVVTIVGGGPIGLAMMGYGISTYASGIETDTIGKVYEEAYEAGLRDVVEDDDIEAYFGKENPVTKNPEDDEVQWLADTVTNLWFESNVNMSLRNGVTSSHTDYLNSADQLTVDNPAGIASVDEPFNELDSYILEKLTIIDTDQGDGRLYKGYAGAELYYLNEDYRRKNQQKIFYSLGLEYDCCSECKEDFPHRVHYSEQSFQEELTDNYRTFLPNNYRDIEGEKGIITDLFRIQNNLYIHTEGALWHLPQSIQERITGDVVSFIGSGEFFSIPPRKITDADKESSGTLHNWARMKTPNGVFFVSENDRKVYLFDGNSLSPISSRGNEMNFKKMIPMVADSSFLVSAGVPYPYSNNPSNFYGTGFISTYDTELERFILTKKDFVFSDRIINSTDYNVCVKGGDFIMFDDYQATIDARVILGWTYEGIIDCEMVFSREQNLAGVLSTEYNTVTGVVIVDPIKYDKSWTISYSLEDKLWVSYHSYLPSYYFYRIGEFYSWKHKNNMLWKHGAENHYQTFYGTRFPHILEYVDNKRPKETKVWNWIRIQTQATEFSTVYNEYVDKDITFNKMISYTAKQSTGLINLKVKDVDDVYLQNQVSNVLGTTFIERAERDWNVNNLRDIVTNYNVPLFRKDNFSLQPEYFIDKVINNDAININKNWSELQSFRDKYLVTRLIFDNFDSIRLITNFTDEEETTSSH